jgi:hypothetical protein
VLRIPLYTSSVAAASARGAAISYISGGLAVFTLNFVDGNTIKETSVISLVETHEDFSDS